MQPGTVGAYPYPLRRQIRTSVNRTLSSQDLNSLILVDSSAGPVVITLPAAVRIGAGGFFQIVALTGDVNPVTISVEPGDSYNQGLVAPIVLSAAGDQINVLGSALANRWWLTFQPATPYDPFFGTAPVAKQEWHFTGNSTGREGWVAGAAGTGATTFLNPANVAMPGAVELSVSAIADTSDFDRLLGGVMGFGAGSPKARFRRIVQFSDAPVAAEDFGMRIGLANGLTYPGSNVVIALEANFAVYGPNLKLNTIDAAPAVPIDTGIPAATLAGLIITVELRVEEDGASVTLALNGVDVGINNAVPATATMQSTNQMEKTAGAAARTLIVDYASEEFQLPEAFS